MNKAQLISELSKDIRTIAFIPSLYTDTYVMARPKFKSREILQRNQDPALVTGRLNVQEFVASRKAEIGRLEAALGASNTNAKKRAFQNVPRVLRRRTASHDAKRVPKRLRDRAEMEIEKGNAKKPKSRRPPIAVPSSDPAEGLQETPDFNEYAPLPVVPKRYAKRQNDKVWLPTHVWHKKRAHLMKLWGQMIPIKPSQKQYRPTHRVGLHMCGSIAWDTSYYSTLLVWGGNADANRHLIEVAERLNPECVKKIYLNGSKSYQGIAELLGPFLMHWQNGANLVVLHVHPALFNDFWEHFKDFRREDCRYSIGSIDLAGSQALRTLVSCMVPNDMASNGTFWNRLQQIGTPSSLPRQAVLQIRFHDPRLTYPHRNQYKGTHESAVHVSESWPKHEFHEIFGLYISEERLNSVRAQESQSEIDTRRRQKPDRGASQKDPKIPAAIYVLNDARIRILLPRPWVLILWHAIMKMPNVLLGCLEQSEQLAYERSMAHFPRDYPHFPAGAEWAQNTRELLEQQWRQRPPGKRPSFEKEQGNPFSADLSLLPKERKVHQVSVRFLAGGVPVHFARIYALPETPEGHRQDPKIENPPYDSLIGFITSGSHNMSEGRGTGIGVATEESGLCYVRAVGQSIARIAQMTPVNDFSL